MKYTFVIEDDAKVFGEVKEAIKEIDPKMGVRQFTGLEEFVDWIKEVVEKNRRPAGFGGTAEIEVPPEAPPAPTPEAAPAAEGATAPSAPPAAKPTEKAPEKAEKEEKEDEPVELVLVVLQAEALKHKGFALLKRTRDYFVRANICTKELPTNFVLTAFETEDFDFSKYENQIVSNIIFKPFDKLILKAHLRIALSGGKAEKSSELYAQKTASRIEMLKDVHLENLSEVGFATRSDQPIKLGTMAKFYGQMFAAGKISSVFAKCVACDPHPTLKGWFHPRFTFFNVFNQQVSSIRRTIKADKKHNLITFEAKKLPKVAPIKRDDPNKKVSVGAKAAAKPEPTAPIFPPVNFIFVTPRDVPTLKENLDATFHNASITEYNDFLTFGYDADPTDSKLNPAKSKEKPMPFEKGKIFLDLKQAHLVAFEPAASETALLLGQPAKAMIGKDHPLTTRIFSEDRAKCGGDTKARNERSAPAPVAAPAASAEGVPPAVAAPAPAPSAPSEVKPPEILRFRLLDEKLAFLKVSSFSLVKHEKLGEVFQLEIAECSEAEKKDYLMGLSRLPKQIHGIFVDRLFLGEDATERWNAIKDLLKDRAPDGGIRIFVMTGQEMVSEDIFDKQVPCEDIFTRPFDAPYIGKKFKTLFPALELKESIEIAGRVVDQTIKVAQPVMPNEISEAGLSINYRRPIDVGSFRKVVLWMPHEIGMPEFLVSCNAVEEAEEEKDAKPAAKDPKDPNAPAKPAAVPGAPPGAPPEKQFICHFIFFGVRDASLKHIRRWIKDYYVAHKSEKP